MAITSINNNQCFLRASEDEMPSIALSSYWRYVFPAGVTFVLANGTMSIAGGFVNWRRAVPGGWARWGFGLGLLATATHFVFGPLVSVCSLFLGMEHGCERVGRWDLKVRIANIKIGCPVD